MTHEGRYHYNECGLDNVYLLSGYHFVDTPRGKAIVIQDEQGLLRAIGMMLVSERRNLNGKEFRFLRHELNQTQADLATVLGVNVQSVARWEKGRTKEPIDGPAQRLLRLIYKEFVGGNKEIVEPLKELAELDDMLDDESDGEFGFELEEGWQPAA